MIAQQAKPVSQQHPFVGSSVQIQGLRAEIESAARSHAKVLITGETGVGKEVVARSIHDQSPRRGRPFVTINCAGVPDTLLESEFFGHVRGSFTDAYRDNPGLLRQAHGGTVFLDEVGEMSLRMQALLLRFLETGEIQTVGRAVSQSTSADVRVITATNRDLSEAVTAREFRDDLYYRLNVLHLKIPPLRERGIDIETLLEHYREAFASQHGTGASAFSGEALGRLKSYAWPGNVRELKNVVERLVLRARGEVIGTDELPPEIGPSQAASDGPDRLGGSGPHQARVNALIERVLQERESFWNTVYPAFMSRDLTRDDLRGIVRTGLERTQGSYRLLVGLFNMPQEDYKRFLGFLKQHDCHLPFQRFRMLRPTDASR